MSCGKEFHVFITAEWGIGLGLTMLMHNDSNFNYIERVNYYIYTV